jgi:hypothetical protein
MKYRILEKTFNKDTSHEYKLYIPQIKRFWKWKYYGDRQSTSGVVRFDSIDSAKRFLESKMCTTTEKVVWEGRDVELRA